MDLDATTAKRIKTIFDIIEKRVSPKGDYLKPIKEITKAISKRIKEKKIKADCFLGGSIGKGTEILGDFDCDIFLRFDKVYTEEEMQRLSREIISPFKPEKLKGSREYYQFKAKGIDFEIVPVHKIKRNETSYNSSDYSVHHVAWVKSHKEFASDIRVAKAFCKGQRIYGAESYSNGISGYALEILTIYYKGFLGLLKNVSKWKERTIIDIENRLKGLNPLIVLNRSKLGPLILIDPITPGRNAASALSNEKYELFKKAAKKFLKNPKAESFERTYLNEAYVKEKIHKKGMITLMFSQKPIQDPSQDKRGTRMHKHYLQILNGLKNTDFKIVKSDWDWDNKNNAFFFIQFDGRILPKTSLVIGPPTKFKNFCNEFRRKYPECYEKNKRLYCKIERKFREPTSYIKEELLDKAGLGKETRIIAILK